MNCRVFQRRFERSGCPRGITTASIPRSAPPAASGAEGVAAFFTPPAYYGWPSNYASSSAAMMYQAAAMAQWTADGSSNVPPSSSASYWPTAINAVAAAANDGEFSRQSNAVASTSNGKSPTAETNDEGENTTKRLYTDPTNLFYQNPNYMKSMLGAAAQWAATDSFSGYGGFPTATTAANGSTTAGNPSSTSPNDRSQPHLYAWMKLTGNKPGESKRTRQTYSRKQTVQLEMEFHSCKYLTRARRTQISETLGLTERQVKIWFQNRRMKYKKEIKVEDGVAE